MPRPSIADHQAIRRLTNAGLDLAQAYDLPDAALLSFPSVGRRTLAWVRAHSQQGLDARTLKLGRNAVEALETLARHALQHGASPAEVLGDILSVSLYNFALAAGRTPHHREADALYEFAENVRWVSAPEDEEE